jgi:hypothetical protein
MAIGLAKTKKVIVFIFDIRNSFKDYAECARFINSVQKREKISDGDFKQLPRIYIDEEQENDGRKEFTRTKNILKSNSFIYPSSNEISSYIESDIKKAFHFLVSIDEKRGDDIVDFQYYYLIKQMYPEIQRSKGFSLLISSPNFNNGSNPLFYKIGQFLSLEIYRKEPDSVLCMQQHNVRHLPYSQTSPKSRKLSKFFPLIEINRASYEILSMNVGEIKNKVFKDDSVNSLREISDDSIFKSSKNGSQGYDLPYLLYGNTISFFKKFNRTLPNSYFNNPEFYDLVKELPLLALMMFAVSSVEGESPQDDIQIKIYESTDYAEGILQLLENITEHSQNGVGYFSFRLHSTDIKKGKGSKIRFGNYYLDSEYKDYKISFLIDSERIFSNESEKIKKRSNKNKYEKGITNNTLDKQILGNTDKNKAIKSGLKELCFLELFVIDSLNPFKEESANQNKAPVVSVFINNVKKRIENENETYLINFLDDVKNVQLSEFFNKSRNLKEYEIHFSNIARHYGLKRFSNSVSASRGYFTATSTYKFKGFSETTFYQQGIDENPDTLDRGAPVEKTELHTIPGTRYQILLPLNEKRGFKQKFVGIDTDIKWIENFNPFLFSQWKTIGILLNNEDGDKYNRIVNNSAILEKSIIENFKHSSDKKTPIFIISVPDNQQNNKYFSAELVSKSILRTLSIEKIKELPKIAFVIDRCPKYFIPEFVHNIMIAYDRFNVDRRNIMKKRQIYCSGTDPFDDFLIMGKDLKEMRKHMINRSALRGAFPSFFFLLNYILEKQDINLDDDSSIMQEEMPFDLILKNNDKTLFEERAEKILCRKITDGELGCRIADSHIQIGSKIHLHNFFDAEILFQSNYFTTRFAALLAKDIYKKILNDNERDSTKYKLIGYGNYSEIVICQTQKLLEYISDSTKSFVLSDYFIVNQEDDRQEIISKSIMENEKEKFIFIVPINSTLTTHNKLHSWFIEFTQKNKSKVFCNYALVLVRDKVKSKLTDNLTDEEKRFWTKIENKQISTRLLDFPVKYFVEVEGGWENPLTCSMCFPKDYLKEWPVIETNITSTIPALQLERNQNRNIKTAYSEIKNIDEIASIATYKHIKRNDNHFLYYFSNNLLYTRYKKNIVAWLKQEKSQIELVGAQSYNFIVTPLNDSNTGFVDVVNESIFENSAQVLRFEINREYRGNFISKYSYITELYENLHQTYKIWPIPSKINFYFVDEGIITGRTINRAKSLILSLFQRNYSELEVAVSVFEGIFVLINRLSKDSISDYIDIEKYHYFSNFPISSIRNYSNFCYLCKKSVESKTLANNSSLNDMQQEWARVSDKLKAVNNNAFTCDENKKGNRKSRDRVIHAVKILELFKKLELENKKISKDIILLFLFQEIISSSNFTDDLDRNRLQVNENMKIAFESCLKLLARPYFVYKYSTRKALLQALVFILAVFIEETKVNVKKKRNNIDINVDIARSELEKYSTYKIKKMTNWLKEVLFTSKENKIWLFKLLVEQFAEIGSTRILRKDFLVHVNNLCRESWFGKNDADDGLSCLDTYRRAIDQITSVSRDESKSIWLEYLLKFGNEFQNGQFVDSKFLYEIWNPRSKLGIGLFLENTKIIRNALKYLSKPGRSVADVLEEKNYYLDNIRTLLEINNFIRKDSISQKWEFKKFDASLRRRAGLSYEEKVDQLHLDFESLKNSPNSNKQNLELENYILLEKESKIPECEISYKNIISSMIELERFLQRKLKNTSEDNAEILIDSFKNICQMLNKISLGNYIEMVLVPPESSLSNNSNVVFVRRFNENGLQSKKKGNSEEDFNEKNFTFNSYYFLEDRLIMKVYDGKEDYRIFIVVYFCENNPTFGIYERDYAFYLRNVLLFRGEIKELIEKNLNGNSLQSWAFAQQENRLLQNTKISRHSEDNIFEKNIDKYINKEINNVNEYRSYSQAIILHLMADINISSIYHNAIIIKNNNSPYPQEFRITQWDELNSITSAFRKDTIAALVDLYGYGKQKIQWDLPSIKKIYSYYLDSPGEELFILISLIENAVKNSPYGSLIRLSVIPFNITEDVSQFCLGYFCIENELSNMYKSEYDIKRLGNLLTDCLLNPIEERWGETEGILGEKNGISLYAANYYCKRILMGLGIGSNYDVNSAIKYKFTKDSTSKNYKITFKVPILYMKGEK